MVGASMRIFFKQFVIATLLLVDCGSTLADIDTGAFSLQEAIDYALENNPDMAIMQARLDQADAQLGESLASFYPQAQIRRKPFR